MKLRTKTIFTAILLALIIYGASQVISILIIQPSFRDLEIQESKQTLSRAESMINYKISDLIIEVTDYSCWDDTYDFVQNQNVEYIESNFVDGTFTNLDLDLAAIVDDENKLIYCQSFDPNSLTRTQTTEETRNVLTSDSFMWDFESTEDTISGLILIDNQPMMVASAPVLTSLGQGPIMGGMLFGRFFDEQEADLLNKLINVGVSIYPLSDESKQDEIVAELLANQQNVVIEENGDSKSTSAYTLLNDAYSDPNFILKVSHQNIAYQQALLIKNVFTVAPIAFASIFGLFTLILLQREITKPISQLACYVEDLSSNSDYSPPVFTHHAEEFTSLTNAVSNTLKRKLEGMNEASRMVAHDLRNPLTGIKGAAYVLKKKYGNTNDEKTISMFKTIDDCLDYSDKIVKDLMDYSSEIKLDKNPVNLEKIINKVLSRLNVPRKIKIINESDELTLMADDEKLERVFTNLILNAMDAMPNGGNLRINTKRANSHVEIDFSDKGVGMSEETLDKLWVPFFTTKAKGMGVGLSMCKRIVEAHGGKIEVQSVEGKGTCFTVFLPTTK